MKKRNVKCLHIALDANHWKTWLKRKFVTKTMYSRVGKLGLSWQVSK